MCSIYITMFLCGSIINERNLQIETVPNYGLVIVDLILKKDIYEKVRLVHPVAFYCLFIL
jgi:hypothetical protein